MQRLTPAVYLVATAISATAFSVTQAATPGLTTLYDFGSAANGAVPEGNLAIGAGGVLYGTTNPYASGDPGYGTVFSLTPPSSPGGVWTQTLLHEFTDGSDGAFPYGGLVIDPSGVLYGTASQAGTSGHGVVFALDPPASPSGAWVESVLFNFPGGAAGAMPEAALLRGANGALYGTTLAGGAYYAGIAFELAPPAAPGGLWTERVLHSFGSAGDGSSPEAALTYSGGVLYGTTNLGGANDYGTVFSLTPPASPGGAWSETVLYSFTGGDDGANPLAALVAGENGVLYGPATQKGPYNCGTLFSLNPPVTTGAPWTLTEIYSFRPASGERPYGTLLLSPDSGVLYGTTLSGGSQADGGTIFRLAPPGTSGGDWTYTVIYTFEGSNGANPNAGLVPGSGGILYGTTEGGGTHNAGTVFALTL
jgi:uncharacterized repeat protein (TIGR03803 family)